MLLNDVQRDIMILSYDSGIKKSEACAKCGIHKQYPGRFGKELAVMTKNYIAFIEALGYDIEITYKKR